MKRNILYLLLPAFLLASCGSDDDGFSPEAGRETDGQIKFEISFAGQGGPQSRASTAPDFTTTWEPGDEIGIFAVKAGEPLQASGNSIHNMKVTYDGTDWDGAYWPNDENKNENLDFYAYYPYDAGMTDPTAYTFSVQADQRAETSGKSNYNLSDLLLAKTENVAKSNNAVQLTFSHALSLVQVEVKREVNVPHFDDNLTVTLTDALTDALLGWTGALTSTGTFSDIVMHKVKDMENTYRCLIPAQTLSSGSKITFVQTTADKEVNMEYHGVKEAELDAKNAHKYSVTLGWGINPDHEYAVGDKYPHVGRVIGIVYWLDYPSNNKSKHGKVVSLDEKTDVKWSTEWTTTSATDLTNGLNNMHTIKNRFSDFNNYPVFSWVHSLNDANEDYSNVNATGIWYLPAKNELQALYAGYSGKVYEDISNWYDYSSMPGYNDQACQNARQIFNSKLTAAGGTAISQTYYWSSSEDVNYNAWHVDFINGDTTDDVKSNVNGARAVLAF